jgi:hypothetical protein
MPASQKYLNQNTFVKYMTIFNSIIGGYLMSQSVHIILGQLFNIIDVIIWSTLSTTILWPIFMLIAFFVKRKLLWVLIYFGFSALTMLTFYTL